MATSLSRLYHIGSWILIFAAFIRQAHFANNGVALRPPMGWISYERFRHDGDCINHPYSCLGETLIRTTVDAMISEGYVAAGYDTVIIDDCWEHPQRDPQTQRLRPDLKRFPSGMKAMGDYIHNRGLKFGLYTDIGTKTCAGLPGSQNYYKLDAQTFADWGVDYVKVDGCNFNVFDSKEAYGALGLALNATGRPMVYSCEWPAYYFKTLTIPNYADVSKVCNVWRNFEDSDDSWFNLFSIIQYYEANIGNFSAYHGPGGWNDPDMMIIGDFGLSDEQERTQMAFWSLWSAPLLISADIRPGAMRPNAKALLQNKNLIKINQDRLGKLGRRILTRDSIHVWRKELSEPNTFVFLIFFALSPTENSGGVPQFVSLSLEQDLMLSTHRAYAIYEAFTNSLLGYYAKENSFTCTVPPYGVYMIKVRPFP